MMKVSCKLNDETFKDGVMKALREYFYDRDFPDKLDADPNLLAFTNGVWELKAKKFRQAQAEDFVCMNTGYSYCNDPDPEADAKIKNYWEMLHPDPGQREYIQKTFARQLYGDSGNELFHIHTGRNATASNGKTKYFEGAEYSLGAYVGKFGIEILTAKQRIEPGKPMPVFETWRGKRILYCTEPNEDETLNSGILKDLTGGEELQYRMLYANDIRRFRPLFKLHMMCNECPKIDGTDSGVKRRMAKLDYISTFVDPSEADPDSHRYPRDPALIQAFKDSDSLKRAFVRLLFRAYEHSFSFEKPPAVLASSKEFLEQNDLVLQFVESYIQKSQDGWFTLTEAREALKSSEYNNGKPGSLKNALIRALNTSCLPQKWFGQQKCTNVFLGFKIVSPSKFIQVSDGLD
jgi:phage/plasmid-associated DNA primase